MQEFPVKENLNKEGEVKEHLNKLGLPSLEYFLMHPVKPSMWKRVVRTAILQSENTTLLEETNSKSTLEILHDIDNGNTTLTLMMDLITPAKLSAL